MDRKDALKTMGTGLGAAGLMGPFGALKDKTSQLYSKATNGLPPLKIKSVKAFLSAPNGRTELVTVKVETSEPGLYGVGDATFHMRAKSVASVVNDYLADLCVGMSVDNIGDIWQMVYQNSYWRNGPVLNNALSGLDMALWDIKGKRANMSVYSLLGGKQRFACNAYIHVSGKTVEQTVEEMQKRMGEGFNYLRISAGGYDGLDVLNKQPDFKKHGFGMKRDSYFNPRKYIKTIIKLFEESRKQLGDEVELMHDIHEKLEPTDAIRMIQHLEQYRPYFIEDPVSPENNAYLEQIRAKTNVPIAMGELFNNPHEWLIPMKNRWIDFIRCHISQVGGITPAFKIAQLGEWFNVRTAWHGPGDCSPIGHAANAHIDLAVWNFGILEGHFFSDKEKAVFPGAPTLKEGFLYVNEAPGLGVDFDEKEAEKYPIPEKDLDLWTQLRKNDGTPNRP